MNTRKQLTLLGTLLFCLLLSSCDGLDTILGGGDNSNNSNNNDYKWVVRTNNSTRWCFVRAIDAWGGDYPIILGKYRTKSEAEQAIEGFKKQINPDNGLAVCQN